MKTGQPLDIGNDITAPDGTVTIVRNVGDDMVFKDSSNPGGLILGSAATALASHAADSTAIHGITDTSDLALKSGGLDEFTEVVITAVGDDEVLAFNNATSQWINQTAAEAGLAASGHTIVSHDTTATGANLTTLSDGSDVGGLHTHSDFLAADGSVDLTGTLSIVGVAGTPAIDMTADGIAGAAEFHIEIGGNDYWRGDGDLAISGDFTMLVGKEMGIGIAAPDGTLHVHTNTAGAVAADGSADDLVVENNAAGGMTILTPAAAVGIYGFGSPTANDRASMRYDHSADVMEFYTTSTLALSIDGNQDLTLAGSMALVSGEVITAETIQAVDATGLQLFEDGGLGMTVADGSGNVTFDGDLFVDGGGITSGAGTFDIDASAGNLLLDGNSGIFCDSGGDFRWRDSDDGSAERMRLFSSTGVLALNPGAADGGYFQFVERSADPANPAEGVAVMWMSDGTDTGDDGDVIMMTTAGAVTKKGVVFDASAF